MDSAALVGRGVADGARMFREWFASLSDAPARGQPAAYVFVMEHPFFAVTDASGRFSIAGLPAGKYTLYAWHETFGTLQQEVEVKAGADGATFVYRPASE